MAVFNASHGVRTRRAAVVDDHVVANEQQCIDDQSEERKMDRKLGDARPASELEAQQSVSRNLVAYLRLSCDDT